MPTTPTTLEPTTTERRLAAFAILSFWLCSVVGQVIALGYARRHGSTFVRRWAWLSLSFEAVELALTVVYTPFYFLTDNEIVLTATFFVLWLVQLGLAVLTIPLAVRAWRGDDAASWLIPRFIADRLPQR